MDELVTGQTWLRRPGISLTGAGPTYSREADVDEPFEKRPFIGFGPTPNDDRPLCPGCGQPAEAHPDDFEIRPTSIEETIR